MLRILLTLAGTLLFISCSSLQKSSKNTSSRIALGSVVLEEQSLTGNQVKSIGAPEMVSKIPVTFREQTFTNNTYKKYLSQLGPGQNKDIIQYIDTLEIKPTYFQLELGDQIDLQQLLNAEENKEFRTYVARNERFGIVYSVSLTIPESTKAILSATQAVFLTETESGMALEFLDNSSKVTLPFPIENVFDYELCSFCWGEARYKEKMVEAIVSYKARCPEGTEKNANKLDGTKEYLKL